MTALIQGTWVFVIQMSCFGLSDILLSIQYVIPVAALSLEALQGSHTKKLRIWQAKNVTSVQTSMGLLLKYSDLRLALGGG